MAITVKHKFVSAIPDAGDTTIVQPSNWNDTHDLTGTVPIANGGTNATTANDGLNNLLPSQTSNTGKVLTTDGTNATWTTNGSGDVVGPASATDNAVARFDSTTGKLIKNSGVTIDNNNNIAANSIFEGFNNTAASGTQIVLTAASVPSYVITGSGGQTIKLPDATTLPNGTTFAFNNNQSSGAITVNNNSNTLIVSIPSGAFTVVTLLSNSIAAGSWDTHDQAPANVSWSTNTFNYLGSITGATWNGSTVQVNRGGTGTTTSTGTGSVVLNTSPTLTTPAITGGTIDSTVIGSTTPAAGTFTTITGQTEVLKGTGQNFLLYSEQFDNGTNWVLGTGSITPNTITAPNGTLTADTYTSGNTSANGLYQIFTVTPGQQYTASVYVQLGTLSVSNYLIAVYNNTASTFIAQDVVPTQTPTSTGWTRISYTFTTPSGCTSARWYPFRNGLAVVGTMYLWGAQVELASTVGTYIPTTTTAVYGTPTLSFSGVAGLGLQSDGSLYVSPAGTGAIQAQATTSTTAGGNARGANAVDWQTSRNSAGQVAGGINSVIGGGANNQASPGYSTIAGGTNNLAGSTYASVLGGRSNQANQDYSVACGGNINTATGYYNFIGGGFTNSGTASAAVTTQAAAASGVTSGSTAVTLAASNALIKVGQLITGTGMVTPTFVAAISGTSLTLSQNANATGTPTLSFYTPHGVVVGGGNNQATGSYSFIGGGGDAGTAANRNVASGDWSVVVGGRNNTASGFASFVGGGGANLNGTQAANTASGSYSFIGGGRFNQTSGVDSSAFGYNNQSNSSQSFVVGNVGSSRSISNYTVFTASANPFGGAVGQSQSALLVLARQTTDATPTVLTSDTNAAGTTNQVILPNNSAYYFKVRVIAGVTGAGNTKAWTLEGAIKRGANAASTAIVGSVTTTIVAADAGASTWTVTATADTTNGGLAITFTGQAGTTIRVVAKCETAEMTF